MRVVLFACGNKSSAVLRHLIGLDENVVGVVYSDTDNHEDINYQMPQYLAADYRIPTKHYKIGNATEVLKKWNPDVIFVVGWRYKIPKEQYSIPSKGTIVFHDSLLPKYRGFAPMNWAIINGETRTGATMFYIADEIDSGDIIGQAGIAITEYDDAKTVEDKMSKAYCGLLETYLPLIKQDKVKRIPQGDTIATYTCKRNPEDGLIDWNKSTKDIYNLIRGLTSPYPGAFTYLHDNKTVRKLFIWKAIPVESPKAYVGRVPGRVVGINGETVRVLTGDGELDIETVSFGGDKITAAWAIKSIKSTLNSIDK